MAQRVQKTPIIPALPLEPTPPTPDSASSHWNHVPGSSKAFNGMSQSEDGFDETFLSPYKENFGFGRQPPSPGNNSTSSSGAGASNPLSPTYAQQPLSPHSPMLPFSPVYQSMSGEPLAMEGKQSQGQAPAPFNFQPMTMSKSPITKSSVGQRRGHKYKHSSVSHQIFLEPAPKPQISLPSSLPLPTILECRRSMSTNQKTRFWCSIAHAIVAAYTLWSASGSLALTSLSHLILFDSLGAMLCVVVDVLGNFEVWKRSSVRHPFGLERAEVLAGFAMSVLLLFMGVDLISHNLQHLLEEAGSHEAHHTHEHARVSPGTVDAIALLAMLATVVSALVLNNHARIGKVMRFAYFSNLPSILSNPSHFLTLTCSGLLLILPLLSIRMYTALDRLLSGGIAVSMCLIGGRLVHRLGLMLLMSYSPSSSTVSGTPKGGSGSVDASGQGPTSSADPTKALAGLLSTVEADPLISRVEEAKVWQVHYGLCMANLKVRVSGGDEQNLARLRDRLVSLVRNRLGGGYGSGGGGQRWEVSVQTEREKGMGLTGGGAGGGSLVGRLHEMRAGMDPSGGEYGLGIGTGGPLKDKILSGKAL